MIPCALLLHISWCCPEGRLRILSLFRQLVCSSKIAEQEEYLIRYTSEPIPVGLVEGSKRINRCQSNETKQTKTNKERKDKVFKSSGNIAF